MHRYHHHERFNLTNRRVAADPAQQLKAEREQSARRDFIQDCMDFLEGRDTDGARRARAEHDRLRKLASEAKRRAMVGADPLNLTGQGAKQKKHRTAAPPVEFVGVISRVVSSTERLTGKNKLDRQQRLAADKYRTAFETLQSPLGGAMDYDRIRGGGGSFTGPAEAMMIAGQTLKAARNLLGARTTVVVDQIVCHGKTAEECARLLYGYMDPEKVASRDTNHVGRLLREALTQLGQHWFPDNTSRRLRTYRPFDSEMTIGDAGVRDISAAVHVAR